MNKKIKTIFMGTPEIATIGLQSLLDSDFFDIQAVVTQQDKVSGRNMQINKSAVKILAEKNNLKIIQSHKTAELAEELKKIDIDLIVVIAYGKILTEEILNLAKFACLNVHASLLPKYRGSSCIQGAILNGDLKSGITIMKMDKGMDTGDIIKKVEIDLDENENSFSLLEKIKKLIEINLSSIVLQYLEKKIIATPQKHEEATYVKLIKKEDGLLNFKEDSAEIIERKIRAYYPWPGSFSYIEKNDLPKTKILFKILKSNKNFLENKDLLAGTLFLSDGKLALKCKDKAIIIEELQIEGKRASNAKEFLRGNPWILGKILTDK